MAKSFIRYQNVKIVQYNPRAKEVFRQRQTEIGSALGPDIVVIHKGAAAWGISGKGNNTPGVEPKIVTLKTKKTCSSDRIGFMERQPKHPEKEPVRYSRLVMVRPADKGFEVLVQFLGKGMVLFPGGRDEPSDGDPIETIVREISEEGTMSPGQLRSLRNFDLLWGSFVFQIIWNRGTFGCVDTYHLIKAARIYDGIGVINKDDEIRQTAWVDLRVLAFCNSLFEAEVPKNTQKAAKMSLNLLPELIRWHHEHSAK